MDKSPFFSVIIPVYNREKYVERALNSLENQTFKNFETIVVDDCSSDNSYLIALNHPLENKKVIKNAVNSERCITRNNGIKQSKGQFICFLDSDDYFLDNHLETFYSEIQNSKMKDSLFFTNSYLETETGDRTEKLVPKFLRQNIFVYLLKYTPNPARVCVSKNILSEMNFDSQLPGIEDLDLWLRIVTKYPVIHIEKLTNVYCTHSNSYSQGDINRFKKELKYFHIIKNKPELIDHLPKKSINRLLSMCHFHLAKNPFDNASRSGLYYHIFKSFTLYPKGYNGKTNKILFVNALYSLPLFGVLFKKSISLIKR